MLNLSWFQTAAANILKRVLDPVSQARLCFFNNQTPAEVDEFIFPSQRPVDYGGTAPKVTVYWPPIMPVQTETLDEEALGMIPSSDYNNFINEHPGLKPMPNRMREFPIEEPIIQ